MAHQTGALTARWSARPAGVALACALALTAAGVGFAWASPGPTLPAPGTEAALLDRLAGWPNDGAVLLGEQHDADAHQDVQRRVVQMLGLQGRLSALVLEMAERGRDTRHLPRTAGDADVREALAWNDRGWPWPRYGPVVMAAVRAGVPVLGGNLPRLDMPSTQADARWDSFLEPDRWEALQRRIHDAHCEMLPTQRLPGMARIQLARDAAMATTVASAARDRGLVLLLAGQVHVDLQQGVPRHLRLVAPDLRVHAVLLEAGAGTLHASERWITPAMPSQDHCAALRPAPR